MSQLGQQFASTNRPSVSDLPRKALSARTRPRRLKKAARPPEPNLCGVRRGEKEPRLSTLRSPLPHGHKGRRAVGLDVLNFANGASLSRLIAQCGAIRITVCHTGNPTTLGADQLETKLDVLLSEDDEVALTGVGLKARKLCASAERVRIDQKYEAEHQQTMLHGKT